MSMDAARRVPEAARELAGRLVELFERDRELVHELNTAQRRLLEANDRLTAGLSARALRNVYGPEGPDLGLSGRRPPVLDDEQPIAALEDVADTIRHAFTEYQGVAEQRRQLGFDVGEANAGLIAAMTSAGFTEAEARRADVDALTIGRLTDGDPRQQDT